MSCDIETSPNAKIYVYSMILDQDISRKRVSGLTVVIPTLNRLELVQRAISSVICSQPSRVEVIVIDDGSEEDLRLRLPSRTAGNISVRCYRFEKNRGPQAARNLGIRRAHFSHIAFLDSDDAFCSDKLDRLLDEMDREDFDLLFHGVRGMPRYAKLARLWVWCSAWMPFHWWITLFNPAATPALVVRRKNRLGWTDLRHCEDWAFLLRYTQPDSRVRYLDEELSSVFRSPGTKGGLSGAAWRMRLGEFKARRMLLRQLTFGNIVRYGLGAIFGVLRIINDLFRRRYG